MPKIGKLHPPPSGPSLRDVQRWMKWIVTDPRGVTPALSTAAPSDADYPDRYRAPDSLPKEAWEKLFKEGSGPTVSARLSVYAEGYFSRLVDALAGDFSTVRSHLGKENFRFLVAEFLKAYPSRTPNIGEVGRDLANFLAHFSEGSEFWDAHRAVLVDLARLEWAVSESFYSVDPSPLDTDSLRGADEEDWLNAALSLDPSLRILELSSVAVAAWLSETKIFAAAPEPAGGTSEHVYLFRNVHRVELRRIPSEAARVLRRMAAGESLNEIGSSEENESSSDRVSGWFGEWMGIGLIRSVHFGKTSTANESVE